LGLILTESRLIISMQARVRMGGRPLFVLDLNGTLLERLTTSEDKAAYRANPFYNAENRYDHVINSFPIILRPHLSNFLQVLFKRGEVAVWSSMKKVNTDAIAATILPSSFCPRFIWSQLECESVRNPGHPKPLLRKPLNTIWSKYPGEFTAQNTIMIDDSSAKLELHPENQLHLPEFQVHSGDFRADRILEILAQRFEILPDMEDYRKAIPELSAGLLPYSNVTSLKR
jgi:NLI interacting factor-like phosphatase